MTTTLLIDDTGNLSFIYDDTLRPLLDLGSPDIHRASHVEPTPDGRWMAHMITATTTPVSLGPYPTRQEALNAERTWLEDHALTMEMDPGI